MQDSEITFLCYIKVLCWRISANTIIKIANHCGEVFRTSISKFSLNKFPVSTDKQCVTL